MLTLEVQPPNSSNEPVIRPVPVVETSNFSCAKSNANELEQRILLICIRSYIEMFDI